MDRVPQADAILHTKEKTIRNIGYDIGYDIGYYIGYYIGYDIASKKSPSEKVPVKVPVPERKSLGESPRVKVPG